MRVEAPDLEVEKWDKLKSWTKVQEEIEERLKNTEKYDDSMTLYYGPQLYHTFQNPVNIKCMTHFSSKVGEMFVSHYRLGKHDQLSVWSLSSMERGAKSDNQSFNINCEVKVFLFVPEHKVYMCFCSDLFMRIYSDAQSNCEEVTSLQCMTNVRCMAYNRETDDVYVGGIGILQKWKINGSEHSATAEPGPMFNTEIEKNELYHGGQFYWWKKPEYPEKITDLPQDTDKLYYIILWVIDIQIDTRNNQLMAITYEGIFVINYMTMKQTHHLQNRHENSLRCCCFYKERDYFITGGGDGTIKVWNSVLFSQVHVFYGHHDVITGLQTHKINPLLFSSSLDGSVQIWRMDNFSKFMRLDLSEKIYSMKLIVDEEFYCQTENQIRIYSLNQFYSLFVPVESSVYKLQLCPGVKDQASRIIASTEDGSVRLFSPVTGATLTIIYPMPTFQVLSCFAYNREMNRLHSVLQNGEVLIFNCDTNPCKAVEMWIPETTDEEVLKIVQLTLGYMKNDTKVTDTVMLGGLRNGQICLLDASECVMIKNLQAHYGRITCMENATDIGETGFKLLETSQKMVTGGADQLIKIWNIGANSGKLYDNIVIQLLLQIPCPGTPEHISMYENTISVSTSDNSDKGKLHMYRMDGQESKEIQYTTLQHSQDEDHTEHITALDKCPLLGLFATASKDGYIKIWNRHNQLIREMGFGEPMHGLCFANTRGDILIGFQNHICSIPLTSYFPRNYLERITRQQFKDEYREPPIRHNNRIKASFDPKAIPQYSVSFSKRTEEKKPCEDEDILEDLEATPREPRSRVQEDSPEQEEENVEEDYIELAAVTLESPNQDKLSETKPKPKTKIKQKVRFREREKDTEVFKEEEDHLVERGYSAPGPIPSKKLKLEKMKGERRKSDTQYLEKISPYERDLMKRKLIIAPDGYIPNSVVRKRLGFVPPSTPVKKTDTWTIESIKLPVAEKPVKTIQTHEEEEEKWEKVKARYLQFLDESSDEGEFEPEISRPPRYGGRPFNGRGRGGKKVRVIDSDDDDDLELDDSEVVEDSDIFTNDNDYDIIQPEPHIQPETRKKEKVKARYLQFLDESSEDNTELSTSSSSSESESESEDSDSEPERTISLPPRHGGGGRPQNAGRGRGKKKVRVIDSDDEDLEFDDSEPVEDTDIFPQGYDIEIGQSLVGGPMSLLRRGSDLKEIRPFSWGDDKDSDEGGRKSSKNSPWKKMQPPLMRTSSTLSNLSTSSSRLGFTGTRKSTPTTPKYELKSKIFDLHRVDLDMGTPERMRRSVGTRSRERTKSFRLTNMVVDEQSTNVTFKEDSKLAHRKGLLPAAVDMDVIRRLLEEDFFPDLNGTASFDLIMQNLIRLLDTDDSELHAKICDYIMCIHRDIGIPDHYLDRIIGKLSLQLGGENSSLKRFGLRTLKEIGADRQDVLAIILPRLMDAQDDIREEAKNVLAALSGVVNKEELLELINSMGLTKQFDSKDEQEEALKALAMRLDIPFRSDSFTDWINNWVDDSSSIYDSEPEVKLDDIEKAWDGRQRKWKQDSLCLTESASRASTRMRELSFLSKGSPTRDLSGLSGTLSGFDDYSTDFSQRDVESSPSDFPPKKKVQQAELTDIVQDYDPDYTKNLLMEDLLKEYSDVRESDLENENEMKIPEKSKRSDTYSKPDNGNDEVVKRIIEDKVVLNRCDSQDESDVGGSTEENGTAVKSSKGHDAVSRLVIDIDLDKRINSTDCGTPIPEVEENSSEEDLERKNTEGQLSGRSSGNSGNRPRENNGNEALGLARQGFLTREEPLLQQREGSSYSAEEDDWFDPRDSGLYKYYKNRYNREKEAEGKFNYKSMSKLFSRTQSGGADETDSQIGSLDSYSQIGDTLSINDSGITSIQDSGIGRDTSDSHGHTPYKASPRLIKEKIQTKPASYRSRIDSHRKHNLSPVKSSSTGTIRGMSIKSSPREKDPDWIKFFQTPTALERKRMEMVKKDYTEGKIKPGSAAVINYINEGLPMLPGELGLRLLKSVKVCGDKDLAPLSDRQHRIESIPGKLGVHTKSEDKGQSKYGILQMQWTTAVPVPVSHDTYPERYSSMSDATSTLGGSSIGTYSIERPLPSIVHKYANTERSSTTQFIDELDYRRLPGSVYSPDYEWDYPIPPPPAKESRISVPYIRKEHDRYCKYYTVVKKKMQNLASKKKASTLEQQLLPKVEIKKALPERLKLPRELTRLSRVPSVLYPPLTLHQLMSART